MYADLIEKISQRAKLVKNDNDYTKKNGLLYCGTCHEPKQDVKIIPYCGNKNIVVNLQCRCERERDKKIQAELNEYSRKQRIKELVWSGVTSEVYKNMTFANDDRRDIETTKLCCNYIRHFREMQQEGSGILFYGEVGKGKTFYAGCIANALLQRGIPVLFTSLSYLVQNRIEAMNKQTSKIRLSDFACFVLDDVGVENATQTAFNIIDEIYVSQKPLIVTTNLTPAQLTSSDSLEKKRIYDRILEMCVVKILISNGKSRLQLGKEKEQKILEILQQKKE